MFKHKCSRLILMIGSSDLVTITTVEGGLDTSGHVPRRARTQSMTDSRAGDF